MRRTYRPPRRRLWDYRFVILALATVTATLATIWAGNRWLTLAWFVASIVFVVALLDHVRK